MWAVRHKYQGSWVQSPPFVLSSCLYRLVFGLVGGCLSGFNPPPSPSPVGLCQVLCPQVVPPPISKQHFAHKGGGGADPLRQHPPSLLEIGREVPDGQRQRRHKEILLDTAEGEKMVFHPMCL